MLFMCSPRIVIGFEVFIARKTQAGGFEKVIQGFSVNYHRLY